MELKKEIRNGLGIAYRALQADLIDMWKNYQNDELTTSKQEAQNIIDGTGKIIALAESIKLIAKSYVKIAEAKPKLEVPPEIGSLEEKIEHEVSQPDY